MAKIKVSLNGPVVARENQAEETWSIEFVVKASRSAGDHLIAALTRLPEKNQSFTIVIDEGDN